MKSARLTRTLQMTDTNHGRRCMAGGINSSQKCPKCGSKFVHSEKRKGCFCPNHPKVGATSFEVQFPGGIHRRFPDYTDAVRFLNYLRVEKDNRDTRFDPDDYRSSRPNSFAALAPKYLGRKTDKVTYKKICSYINRAAASYLGPMNIREISGGDIEDYLYSIPNISEKTRFNHMTQLRDFWTWCLKREKIITLADMPTFPDIDFELGWRKITDWDTQAQVIEKVREIARLNPKIHLGIDMLATYTALRPDDLRRVTEASLDDQGFLTIHKPTKRKNQFKMIRLLDEHIQMWREIQQKYPAMPDMPFFRHVGGIPGCKPDQIFGPKYFNTWWTAACKEIGIEGVPLYPGTKHTTATATAKALGKEAALTASGLTNKAFERYCQVESSGAFDIVTAARNSKKKTAEVLPLKRRTKK